MAETASSPILQTIPFTSTNKHLHFPHNRPHFLSLHSPKSFNFRNNINKLQLKHFSAAASSPEQNYVPQKLAILLEVEGKSAGDEERMVILFFNKIGWPSSLPTSEKGTFMKSILREKKKALDDLVLSKSLPLRPGVEEFIDDACKEDIPVVILTAYSKSGELIARSIVEKLGDGRISKIKIIGNKEVENSLYGQLVFGKGVSSSLDEQLAKEARKAASAEKQRIAEEVASMLKLNVEIDTTSAESLQGIVAALRAGAEYAGVPVHNCVLVAGSQSGVAGAETISMPCIVLRSSLTSRAEFPSASAVMEGFGSAELTISRLRNKRWY